jgi:hypothetical protein
MDFFVAGVHQLRGARFDRDRDVGHQRAESIFGAPARAAAVANRSD